MRGNVFFQTSWATGSFNFDLSFYWTVFINPFTCRIQCVAVPFVVYATAAVGVIFMNAAVSAFMLVAGPVVCIVIDNEV